MHHELLLLVWPWCDGSLRWRVEGVCEIYLDNYLIAKMKGIEVVGGERAGLKEKKEMNGRRGNGR
jgi:hypothetical protein